MDRPSELSTLDSQPAGTSAVVAALGAAESGLRRRLMEMGFVPGVAIRVVRAAPLGDPLEVELHGYHLSMRRSEARVVQLRHA